MTRRLHIGLTALVALALSACGPGGTRGTATPVAAPPAPANGAPVARPDRVFAMPGTQTKAFVLDNDTDPDGNALVVDTVEAPSNGTVRIETVTENGQPVTAVIYLPQDGFTGRDIFRYRVSDGNGGTAEADVDVAVGLNIVKQTAPLAVADLADTAVGTPVSVAVLANDLDGDGDSLRLTAVSAPAHGTVTIDDGGTPLDRSDDRILYTPNPGFEGVDSFVYTVTDGTTPVDGTVRIDVQAAPDDGEIVDNVRGRVVKGPMIGARIELYAIDATGAPTGTQPLAQAVTDSDGRWSARVPEPRTDLLVVTRGGAWLDEAQQSAGPDRDYILFRDTDRLLTVLPRTDTVSVQSIYTHALTLRTQHLASGANFLATLSAGRAAFAAAYGFDVMSVEPANPAFPAPRAGALARSYALAAGGAANVVNRVGQYYGRAVADFEMVNAVARDLSDCRLDGRDLTGPIRFTLGGVPTAMPVGLDLNREILRFRNNNLDAYRDVPLLTVIESLCDQPVGTADTTPPVLSLLGSNPMAVPQGTPFVDPGATASDDVDGDLSALVTASGAVDTSVAGSYTVTYVVSDSAGNTANLTRTVNVIASSAPVISLLGPASVTVEAATAYADAGALASDAEDGDLTASLVVTNLVDLAVPGVYAVHFDVTDTSGTPASRVTRTVTVVDTTPPAIGVLGAAVVNVYRNDAYADAGATASDTVDGDLTAAIVTTDTVDTTVLGTYTVTYQVADAAGNAAVATRTVQVVPDGVPVIVLTGPASVQVEAGTPYADAGATASDPEDGDLTGAIVTVNPVDTSITGTFVVTYDVTDSNGNAAAQVTRSVTVADTLAPSIALNGPASVSVAQFDAYADAGATASDSFDGDLTAALVVGNPVDTAVPGIYTVTFDVSDAAGNDAPQVTRTVTVVANAAPTITLLGTTPVVHEAATPYSDAGATASDPEDGDITASIVTVNPVDANVPGNYVVTYDVSDGDGNAAAQVTRSVQVVDTTAPTITLTGPALLIVEAAGVFADPGATAADTLDGDLTGLISVSGSVNMMTPADYVLAYDVSDAAGNAAATVNRTVRVVDTTPPVITLAGNSPQTVAQGAAYTDAGATASDTLDGDLTGAIVVVNPVDTSTLGTYFVTYNVDDAAGNAAAQVTRQVEVRSALETIDSDGDGLSDALENRITGDMTATQTNTFFVDASAAAGGDGTTWASAFRTLEEVAAANGGTIPDGVSPAAPTYVVLGDTTADPATVADPARWIILVENGFCSNIVFVGSMGDGIIHPGSGPSPATRLNAPGDRVLNATNCANLQFHNLAFVDSGGGGVGDGGAVSLTNSGAIFDGVTFDNNRAAARGGAVYLQNTLTPVEFRNSRFTGNELALLGSTGGGALHLAGNADTIIDNVVFYDNEAEHSRGGAVYAVASASFDVSGSAFSGNEASTDGGAFYIERGNVSVTSRIAHSVLSGNDSGGDGGAVYVNCYQFAPPLRLFNNLITANGAARGGALAIDDCSDIDIDNNTIALNDALSAGGAVYVNTVSTASPPTRPMPLIWDNVLVANIAVGAPSVYSINNLPAWDRGESYQNLMDDVASATTWDVVATDLTLEFESAWYLLQGSSQAIDLSSANASNANKFGAVPERTTATDGSADLGKADAGYHYVQAYPGAALSVTSSSTLEAFVGNSGQPVVLALQGVGGTPVGSGYRVAVIEAPGSAPVTWKTHSAAQDPLLPSAHYVAADRGDGTYSVYVGTNGVTPPADLILDVYVDGVFVGQVTIPIS